MVVDTTSGKVEGVSKDGVLQFRGLPFARAERFRPPAPPAPWPGVRRCDTFAPAAPQGSSPLEQVLGATPTVSDEGECLALNVFTPSADDRRRPVMVWLHGGSFVSGTGSTPWYSGSRLVTKGDVVVVTLNYRLGMLGFLHLDGVLDGPEFAGSGNNGLRDQVAALEWVRDNIGAFGGDPANVTVFGESAGGMSIGTLLGTPAAAGLFRRAILQSGAASYCQPASDAEAVSQRVLGELGLRPGGAEGLLSAPVEELLAAQARVVAAAGARLAMPFSPVVDGVVVPQPPLSAVRAGAAAGIPLLMGTTADEFNLFALAERMGGGFDEGKLRRRLARLLEERADEALELYGAARPGAEPIDLWCALASDRYFGAPAVQLAEAQAEAGGEVWMYRFSYRSRALDGALGACHAVDIPFVFHNLHRRGMELLLGPLDSDARIVESITSSAWLAMARHGNPNHEGLPNWPRYDTGARPVMDLDVRPSLLLDPAAPERVFWESVAEQSSFERR